MRNQNTCNTSALCSLQMNTVDRGRGGSLGFVDLSGRFGSVAKGEERGRGGGAEAG